MITGNYNFGNYLIFDKDCYGVSPILDGACPKPTTPVTSNRVFDLTGEMFSNAFSHAKDIGVQTCVGTEIPMTKPDPSVDTQTYYEGIFQRIMASHHLDYYWLFIFFLVLTSSLQIGCGHLKSGNGIKSILQIL